MQAKIKIEGPAGPDMLVQIYAAGCTKTGGMRRDAVGFGEMLYRMDEIYRALSRCDLFISIGTSGTVYPAASFVEEAAQAGAHTAELGLEPSVGAFREANHGRATEIVPA
jgi:NAD-dependent deacetylase